MIHPKLKTSSFLLAALCLVETSAQATTIVPFDNYAEMAKSSKSVVLAKVVNERKQTFGANTYQVFDFTVQSNIKGNLAENTGFSIKSMSFTANGLTFKATDDLEFEEGRTYLLTLEDQPDFFKVPKLLNYAIFEEIRLNNKAYLVPTEGSKHAAVMPTPSGKSAEALIEVDETKFINNLKSTLYNGKPWSIYESKADKAISLDLRVAPTGCVFVGSSTGIAGYRWQDINLSPLNIYKQSTGDLSLATPSSVFTTVNNATSVLATNYNVFFSDKGTTAFTPTCSNGTSASSVEGSSNFITYMNNLAPVNSTRKAMVVFNDPCNSITNLSNCSGVLAYGGAYYGCTATHTFSNDTWQSACYGFVVVNNGVGACSNVNYTIMLEHELTHVLGMGHLDPTSYPGNNMNPSCCNAINTKDLECMTYAYGSNLALPVELTDFRVKSENHSVDIEWSSKTEINHKMYILERSRNGKDYESIGQFQAKGSAIEEADYAYTDEMPYSGYNYYRLRMLGKDGKEAFSKVVSVKFKPNLVNFKIYPNPSVDNVSIYITSPNENDLVVDILDSTGRLVSRNTLRSTIGESTLNIQTLNWSRGVYFVRLTDDTNVITRKMTKS